MGSAPLLLPAVARLTGLKSLCLQSSFDFRVTDRELLLLTGLTQLTLLALHDHRCSDSAQQQLTAVVRGLKYGFWKMAVNFIECSCVPHCTQQRHMACGRGRQSVEAGVAQGRMACLPNWQIWCVLILRLLCKATEGSSNWRS
jgi:hypothetical protein